MEYKRIIKPSFRVMGIEGSTEEGEGFVQRLWERANASFSRVERYAKRREDGSYAGFWGCMTDFSRAFLPWEDGLTKGLYLAGAEVEDDAIPPRRWTLWVIPGFEYLAAEAGEGVIAQTLGYMKEEGLELVGAIQDFNDPVDKKSYTLFPIRKL